MSSYILGVVILFVVAAIAAITIQTWITEPVNLDPFSGGQTSILNRTSRAFDNPAANLTPAELDRHSEANTTFNDVFVSAPSSVNPGLGPLFNNTSCNGCHLRNGRGMPIIGSSTALKSQLLVRVSLPQEKTEVTGGALPVPNIGTQIRDHAIFGYTPNADVTLNWQETIGKYADGTSYKLRSPVTTITLPDGKPLPSEVLTSLRLPPPIIGLGLLEALEDKTILALADPNDKNGDDISGKPNMVWDVSKKTTVLGKFGLKANQPNLRQQTAAAYFNDMGVTNPLFPDSKSRNDIDEAKLVSATFYTQSLTVPARAVNIIKDKQVQKGDRLFNQSGCASCHIPTLKTGNHELAAISDQTIHPYTDLLLHDLGAGLADHRPDFLATGTEWRTSPLWAIGLTQTVLPGTGFLHDGRARTLEEAVLWHGGEAEKSKQAFINMSKGDRQALIQFLRSL
ncbi:putative thiol oxidoreductase [Synechococcus sp. PCC 7502]|uniref:di-heme oxidoreductase family protein n=1 Tax=Synechococcus sp. PCC 7502 TaxID=1173263 RepID=UPI00029FE1DD|nr:di-heme oxidoredictase family protein [Synechococcus sp. PCC 7502]AFY72349.1 putative thiol oxidoreductase [Synechococcus sp. PCC 7502]